MMKTGRRLDPGAQVVHWILARRSDRMTRKADQLFRKICADAVLAEYMVSLPLGGLPEIRRALSARASEPGQTVLEETVRIAIQRDWQQLSPATINRAAKIYVCCLGRILLNSASVGSAHEPALAHQVID